MESREKAGIVAFGFGEPARILPNWDISVEVEALCKSGKASVVFTDRDIAPQLYALKSVPVQEIDPERMPTTYRLALFAVKSAKERGLTTLHVVAAQCHIWRCLRDLKWAAKECGVNLAFVSHARGKWMWDKRAETKFTRSALRWWPLEIAYRVASTVFPNWYKRTRA